MVSSWLILQIASLFCSALGLPSWTLKAILALLLVGFGAALIIGSWIDLRAARLADAGPLRWSGKVHLVFWPAEHLSLDAVEQAYQEAVQGVSIQ